MRSTVRRSCTPAKRVPARMRALALLLCLVTWRGPLPCLHDHETDLQAAVSDATLARHLVDYHTLSHEADEGWHLHLLLPFGRCPGDDSEDDPSDTPDPLSIHGTLLTRNACVPDASSAFCAWRALPAACLGTAASDVPTQMHHRPPPRDCTFLGSLLSAAPLRAVTGVALC